MANPCDANPAGLEFWKDRLDLAAMAFCEEGGNDHLGQKISLVPTAAKLHVHVMTRFLLGGDFTADEFRNHRFIYCP